MHDGMVKAGSDRHAGEPSQIERIAHRRFRHALRAGWASMPQKSLLTFLRAYAISNLFHRADRIKYWTSIRCSSVTISANSVGNGRLIR